jgi:outer membrane receptor protein involved in Fe transport
MRLQGFPSSRVSISIGCVSDSVTHHSSIWPRSRSSPCSPTAGFPIRRTRATSSASPGRVASDAYNLAAKLDYQLNDVWALTAQLAFDDNRRDSVFPNIYDLTPQGDILEGDIWYAPDQRSRILSSQTLLAGRIDTGPIAHELTLGVSTYRFDADNMGYVWPPLLTGNIYPHL